MAILYRQGDVLLIKHDRLPSSAVLAPHDSDRIVLASGKATGHEHAVSPEHAQSFHLDNETFLEVTQGAVLRHDEHAPIQLEPGIYKVVRQREFDPTSFKYVND